jgi:hypothetical protein
MANEKVTRVMGGSPGAVIIKLIFASILVGALLAALGYDPANFVRTIIRQFERILDMGWGAVETILRWALYGAVIVVPVWLVMRLLRGGR